MFKITKFNICIIGMLVGIGLISLLPFMGLTCRWGCAAVGGGQKVEEVLKPSSYYFMPSESTFVKNVCIMRSYLCVDTESIMASIQKEKRSCYLYSNKKCQLYVYILRYCLSNITNTWIMIVISLYNDDNTLSIHYCQQHCLILM